jgi:hypothetical protein
MPKDEEEVELAARCAWCDDYVEFSWDGNSLLMIKHCGPAVLWEVCAGSKKSALEHLQKMADDSTMYN